MNIPRTCETCRFSAVLHNGLRKCGAKMPIPFHTMYRTGITTHATLRVEDHDTCSVHRFTEADEARHIRQLLQPDPLIYGTPN